MNIYIHQFRHAIEATGLEAPPEIHPDKSSDFNDLYRLAGVEAVIDCFIEIWRF